MRLIWLSCFTLFLCLHSAALVAAEFSDRDADGFIDIIEWRYAAGGAVGNPALTPSHGAPIMIGQTDPINAVQRFPELDNAVAIDAGGFGGQQYVLILKGDGTVASWSLVDSASIEDNLYASGQWVGTHPRQWEGIVDIEVAPFGLFGIGVDGTVSMCGERWAVSAVNAFGDLREIETSYDSLIVVTRAGVVRTATNGHWINPVVPDLSSNEEFSGPPRGVAAGKQTFWVLGSSWGVKAWGNIDELAKMNYSAFATDPLSGIYVSPTDAAGIRVIAFSGRPAPFGDNVSDNPSDSYYYGGSFTTTPGAANAFSSLWGEGYHTTASFLPDHPIAPSHWQFYGIASSESALFGILRDGSSLEWAVADELGHSSPIGMDENDWVNLDQLNLMYLPIASLDGLEQAVNLHTLNIEGTTVRDLSPVDRLDFLSELNAARTPVMDLSPLAGRVFEISDFHDTAAVEVERELRTAFAYDMRRVYAEFLARNDSHFGQSIPPLPWWHQFDAGLSELIRVNQFYVTAGLESLSVVDVLRSDVPEAEGLELTSLQGVALLSELRELTVPDQKITDISDLADLPLLNTIDLSNNPVVDLSALLRLRSLQSVDISDTGAAEILVAAQQEMPVRQQLVATLAELERRGVSVQNTSANPRNDWQLHFEEQTAAGIRYELNFYDTALTFNDLEEVHVFIPPEGDFVITDLSGLQYAWQIQEIRLYEQPVSDLGPLKDLPYLSRLYIQHYFNEGRRGRVADLSPLAGHSSLEHIELNGSDVLDISPVVNLPRLEHLELSDTFLADLLQYGNSDNPAVQAAHATVNALEASGVPVYLGASPRGDWWRVFEPALGRALRDGFGGGTDLRLSDLENIQILGLENKGIVDLEGMQLLYQLEDLSLNDNAVVDLSPLSTLLNLRFLNLWNNPIVDLKPLLSLQALEDVDLSETSAAELAYDTGYYINSAVGVVQKDLAALRVRGVNLQDYNSPRDDWWRHMDGALAAHTLDVIGRGDYRIELYDLLQIPMLPEPFDLLRPLSDLSGIQYLMGLEDLSLPNQLVTDLTPLSFLSHLRYLDLSNPDDGWPINRLSDLEPLSGHAVLEHLELNNTDVVELEPILTMPSLNIVAIEGTFADDLLGNGSEDNPYAQRARTVDDSFSGTLYWGSVNRNDWWRVFDPVLGALLAEEQGSSGELALPFLESLPSFHAAEKGIQSLERIGLLYGLDTLQVSSNPITDLSPLAELSALRNLSLGWVGLFAGTVLDIEPLATMPSLVTLDLSNNPLLDIEPLLALPLLGSVELTDTYVTDQPDNPSYWVYNVLQHRGVTLYADSQPRDDWSWLFDPNLARKITEQAGRPLGSGFSHANLLELTELNAAEAGIESLAGLELLPNLEILNLESNAIVDLSPLASLKGLRSLNLGTNLNDYPMGNLFRDLSPLANLWSLQDLNLRGTAATDFRLLAELPSLNQVDLQDSIFDNTSELSERLAASGISVPSGGEVDASRILAPSLYRAINSNYGAVDLYVSDLILDASGVTSLEGIAIFAELEHLSLRYNQIADLDPLEGMLKLREIDISNQFIDPFSSVLYGNQVSDISVLATLPKLEVFSARANLISDISPLLDCSALRVANIEDNFILGTGLGYDSPDGLVLMNLSARGVSVNAYTWREDWYRIFPDPALAAYFANAREDDISNANNLPIDQPVYDLRGLEKCYNLQSLRLSESHVQDLSPLSELQGLEILNLDREDLGGQDLLTDLSPLADLKSLRELSLRNQGVRDLSVLLQLTNLTQVDLSGNLLDLRVGSAASEIIEKLDGQIIFALDNQRDIWGTIADVGLERAIRNFNNLGINESITQTEWDAIDTLNAVGFGIEDISQLSLANNLRAVNLAGNRISDPSSLSTLQSLETVGLGNASATYPEMENRITDLSVFAGIETLKHLDLQGNQVADVSPLLRMRNLNQLNLDGNPLDLRENSDTVRLLEVLLARGTDVSYDDRYRTGKSEGIALVESDPRAYDLFTENQLRGLALGQPTLELDADGKFQLKLDVFESVDLIEWLPGQGSFEEIDGQFIWKPSNPGDTLFYTIEAQ